MDFTLLLICPLCILTGVVDILSCVKKHVKIHDFSVGTERKFTILMSALKGLTNSKPSSAKFMSVKSLLKTLNSREVV